MHTVILPRSLLGYALRRWLMEAVDYYVVDYRPLPHPLGFVRFGKAHYG